MPAISLTILIRRNQFFLPRSRYLIWWRGVCWSMGYMGRAVYNGLVCVRLWSWHQVSVPWSDRPILLPRAWYYCGGAIFRRWVSIFVWWVELPILIQFFASDVSEINFCVRARDVGMITKIIDNQPMRWCLNVGLVLKIVTGHVFLPRYIKVRQLK